jgi:hypothetical protein
MKDNVVLYDRLIAQNGSRHQATCHQDEKTIQLIRITKKNHSRFIVSSIILETAVHLANPLYPLPPLLGK